MPHKRAMTYRSPYPDAHIPEIPLADFVLAGAAAHPDKPALIDGGTQTPITYQQLLDNVRDAARGLAGYGVRRGDVVALSGPNSPEYVAAFYAITSLGAIVTTLNPIYNVAELSHQLTDSGASVLLAAGAAGDAALRAAQRTGVPRLDFAALAGQPRTSSVSDPVISPTRDVAALIYSNSTADVPMGVRLTHFNLVANLVQTGLVEPIEEQEVLVGMMPFCQMYAMVAVNIALRAGATIVTLPKFSVSSLLSVMERHRVTTAYMVPPTIRVLSKHPLVDQHDLSALRHIISLTAPLPEIVGKACAERIGCTLRQAYGLTEAVAFTHFTPRAQARIATMGQAVPNTEFRIVDVASRTDVAPGRLGEILVRGPQVMQGYHNFPDITAQMIDVDGWLHTCDLGYADPDGYLSVVDRSKKLIRLRGLHREDDDMLRASIEDIAARREASERARFQSVLLDSVHESVVGTNLMNRVTFWNKGAERLFGYTAAEALGRPVTSLIFPPGEAIVRDDKTAALRSAGTWNAQVVRHRKDGTAIWTDLTVSLVKNVDNERSGFVGIHRDITELKKSQALLEDSHERLRNLAARLMVVREQERSSIARELHDELGQSLTRLTIDLAWLNDKLPQRLRTSRFASMSPLVDRMLKTVQHISSELRPPILDDLGLEAAIEWHAQEFGEWSGCRCHLDLRLGTLPRNRDRDITVFRILQESLTNVARHARAATVIIRAWVSGIDLTLEVSDDGIGLPEGKLSSPESLGILGMRERADALGGSIRFASEPGGGSTVTLHVPLAASVPMEASWSR